MEWLSHTVFLAICLNYSMTLDKQGTEHWKYNFLEVILKDQHQNHGLECKNMEREEMLMHSPEKCLGLQGTRLWTDRGEKTIDCQTLPMIPVCYNIWDGVVSGHVDAEP